MDSVPFPLGLTELFGGRIDKVFNSSIAELLIRGNTGRGGLRVYFIKGPQLNWGRNQGAATGKSQPWEYKKGIVYGV